MILRPGFRYSTFVCVALLIMSGGRGFHFGMRKEARRGYAPV